MIKYIANMTQVVSEELPECFSLVFNISNCQNRCKGCHSAFLRNDIGDELTIERIKEEVEKRHGLADCILFMGEGNDQEALFKLSDDVKTVLNMSTALYSGRDVVEDELYKHFDYVKIGAYKAEFGPLDKKTTNQRLYKILPDGTKEDITYKFWKND